MPEPAKAVGPSARAQPIRSNPSATPPPCALAASDKVICERCGSEMFRMHAVWRCPACRFKTDCCGW